MSDRGVSSHGDFLRTPAVKLRLGLAATDQQSWGDRLRDGLELPAQVYRDPNCGPLLTSVVKQRSGALAVAVTLYAHSTVRQARRPGGVYDDARLKIYGLNDLAMAMVDSPEPEIQDALASADTDMFAKHLPVATDLMSRPPKVRDRVLGKLGEHRPFRGMLVGVGEMWQEALAVVKEPEDPERPTKTTSIVLRGRQPEIDPKVRAQGVLFGNGHGALVVATAIALGYIDASSGEIVERPPGSHGVIRLGLTKRNQVKRGPATPPELHTFSQEKAPALLGITVAESREVASRHEGSDVEALESTASALYFIHEAVTRRIGGSTGMKLPQADINAGSGALALAYANTTDQHFADALQSMADLLDTNGLRDSERLKKSADAACARVEKMVEDIAVGDKDLRAGTVDLLSNQQIPDPNYQPDPSQEADDEAVPMVHKEPLFAAVNTQIINDAPNYGRREIGWQADKFNAYLAGALAFNETLCELVSTIPALKKQSQEEVA